MSVQRPQEDVARPIRTCQRCKRRFVKCPNEKMCPIEGCTKTDFDPLTLTGGNR